MGKEKLITFEGLSQIRERHGGQRIVLCHGVFDLFHIGHLSHLKSAREYGDLLVVTLTKDRFVNKGPGRPRYSEEQRARLLSELEVVDYVAINPYPHGIEPIQALQPDFYVKGPDYRKAEEDITGKILEEESAVNAVGGTLVFTSDETESSTELLNRYFNNWDDKQRSAIQRVKDTMSVDQILEIVDSLAEMKVLVVGEPIVDTYVFCRPENISTKSPTVSAKFLKQEDYAGGSLAIANHLAELGCDTSLLITHGDEPYFKKLLSTSLNKKVDILEHVVEGIPTPRKTRYLTTEKAPQRIFELIDLRADQWLHSDPAPFCSKLEQIANSYDVVICADFGHGMFEGLVKGVLPNIRSFVAMNVQTNSGNLGFNPFTKHDYYDYLCIDQRECRLGMHDRFTPSLELARQSVVENIKQRASITLSEEGAIYFDRDCKEFSCPAFFKEIIDTTGAGDAYFTITSLLTKEDYPGQIIPFLGNCYAGLGTRIIGNKSAVSKVDLIRTVKSILK